MFIDGIKAIPSDGSEPRLWKFRNPQGAYKHLCVLAADEGEARLIRQSLGFALFGTRAPLVKSVLVALTDDNGDSWIFERNGEQFRCLKNRQLLDTRTDAPLRDLFADFLPLDAKAKMVWQELIRSFDLKSDGQDIIAGTEGDRPQRQSPFEQAAAIRTDKARQSLETSWGQAISGDLLNRLLLSSEAFQRRSLALRNQTRDLNRVFEQIAGVDNALIKRLEQELDLIEQIRRQAEPLMQAGKSPKAWNEKLQLLEQQRVELESAIAQEGLPFHEDEIAWENVLGLLTRYLACDRLEKSARASLSEAKDKLGPVHEAHKAQMQAFLAQDQELIRTFEACLHELEAVMNRAAEGGRSRDNLSSKLNKLLGFNPAEPLKMQVTVEPEDGLAEARQQVNGCLQVLAELGSKTKDHGSVHNKKIQEFEGRYQQIAEELQKAKDAWEIEARQLGLPLGISVSQLILAINLFSQLSAVRQRMGRLQDEYQDYKAGIRQLSNLMEGWRTHTGSQKSLALEHPNVILAEAKGVISYADKKQAQLRKLRSVEAQIEAFSQLQQKLQQDESRLAVKWIEAMRELGLPEIVMSDALLETTIAASRELILLETLRPPVAKALQNEDILADAAFDAPFVVFSWNEAAVANRGRLRFMQMIESSSPHGYALILCADPAFAEMMQKMGLSYGQRALNKAPEAASAAPKEAPKPLISDKARSALEVFATKQAAPRRETIRK